jgi:nitrile hydratase beta subunit-like protein
MTDSDGRRWFDLGGRDAGAVLPEDHDFALWEKRVDALMVIASAKGYFTVDGLRRSLEDMGEEAFETMSYYERWVLAVSQNLIEAGAYTPSELGERMNAVQARGSTYGECATAEGSDG